MLDTRTCAYWTKTVTLPPTVLHVSHSAIHTAPAHGLAVSRSGGLTHSSAAAAAGCGLAASKAARSAARILGDIKATSGNSMHAASPYLLRRLPEHGRLERARPRLRRSGVRRAGRRRGCRRRLRRCLRRRLLWLCLAGCYSCVELAQRVAPCATQLLAAGVLEGPTEIAATPAHRNRFLEVLVHVPCHADCLQRTQEGRANIVRIPHSAFAIFLQILGLLGKAGSVPTQPRRPAITCGVSGRCLGARAGG